MTYTVVFDVSERVPQLVVGIVATVALAVVIVAGILDTARLVARWAIVFAVGAGAVLLQFALAGEWPYLIAAAVVFGVILYLGQREELAEGSRRGLPHGSRRTAVGLFSLVFAAFVGLPMIAAIDLSRRLEAGEALVVEGPVEIESFGKTECLAVADQQSCYSEAVVTPGYNRRQYLIGAIESGTQVRLSILDDMIVRLEVAG